MRFTRQVILREIAFLHRSLARVDAGQDHTASALQVGDPLNEASDVGT